jgi:serine phosphatase RsbU (regulator of sigma subunit)
VRVLSATGERLPLGLKADAAYEPLTTRLETGERLLFLSDGIPEAPVKGEPLGYERVETMLGTGTFSLDGFLDRVREVVDEGLSDDWTAVVVERT